MTSERDRLICDIATRLNEQHVREFAVGMNIVESLRQAEAIVKEREERAERSR